MSSLGKGKSCPCEAPSSDASPVALDAHTASRSSRMTTAGARREASSAARRSAAIAGRASPCMGKRAHSTETTAARISGSSRRRFADSFAAAVRPELGAPQKSAPPVVGGAMDVPFAKGSASRVKSLCVNAAFSLAVAKSTASVACAPSLDPLSLSRSSSRGGCTATASPNSFETSRGAFFCPPTSSGLESAGGAISTRAKRAKASSSASAAFPGGRGSRKSSSASNSATARPPAARASTANEAVGKKAAKPFSIENRTSVPVRTGTTRVVALDVPKRRSEAPKNDA
mmetsp:Transcript_13606/g.57183  ORF Transcript_13606/g.57183 Transcript_13606/m.57183 type:complete len:287 (+) Transcript_13606:1483-2343(+)